ncbi:MAG TPA: SMI1/KNR4 family protein [Planctomycetota bacterium]|nr:SMI1/KNR4 family protein [Planctomycetota bacterium]
MDRLQRLAEKIGEDGITLLPRLSEEAVAKFEARQRITLPVDFRRFIMEIGNGDIGPDFDAFVPLGQSPQSGDEYVDEFWQKLPDVHLPFPFTRCCNWDMGETSIEGTLEQSRNGCILLRYGYGEMSVLIVTGPERGNVWWLYAGEMEPYATNRDFLTWCEREITIVG